MGGVCTVQLRCRSASPPRGNVASAEKPQIEDIVNSAVGPFEDYCDGYGNPGASGLGYVSALKLETGIGTKPLRGNLDGVS